MPPIKWKFFVTVLLRPIDRWKSSLLQFWCTLPFCTFYFLAQVKDERNLRCRPVVPYWRWKEIFATILLCFTDSWKNSLPQSRCASLRVTFFLAAIFLLCPSESWKSSLLQSCCALVKAERFFFFFFFFFLVLQSCCALVKVESVPCYSPVVT